ncbi:GrpE protein [Reticulomyxa filosa]|uniref:GrpE protein n=1 Tax=Reticulomyxa filosa TaxID=46433 RepID=X6LYV4_RETFI|nr:GrpE protein [Reticulomyxa filosa]|eukprot:ETO05885.1 GrpE protein [Reticulomyxa filosa]
MWEEKMARYQEACAKRKEDLNTLTNMSKKDEESARNLAIRKFSLDILAVADSVQSALRMLDTKANLDTDPQLKALVQGMRDTQKTLLETFERHAFKKFSIFFPSPRFGVFFSKKKKNDNQL